MPEAAQFLAGATGGAALVCIATSFYAMLTHDDVASRAAASALTIAATMCVLMCLVILLAA
jgi:FtsH-binding integral membrane protein